MQILDAAVQHVYRMDNSQVTDLRHLQLDRTTGEIFGGKTSNTREEIHLLHLPTSRAVSHFAGLRRRIIERRYPDLPAETPSKILCENGIADEIGICRHTRNEILWKLHLQMICPEG